MLYMVEQVFCYGIRFDIAYNELNGPIKIWTFVENIFVYIVLEKKDGLEAKVCKYNIVFLKLFT